MTILGTRPDAVKLAPVVAALATDASIDSRVAVTAQHRDMLDQVLWMFQIEPDCDLDLMQHGQGLADFAGRALKSLADLFAGERPDLVIVQGDTTTAMAGALAAHYTDCRVAHVEAGLRSGDLRHPFPEEANRRIVSQLADLHFAPTEANRRNLLREGVDPARIHVTGNTVIDALLFVAGTPMPDDLPTTVSRASAGETRLILATLHRRESFGAPLDAICVVLKQLVDQNPDVELLLPVHPNPNVRKTVLARLEGHPRIQLVDPLGYRAFVAAMKAAYFIITDSGGVQEEAPSLNKPVLVLRDATERPEVVAVGAARLVGRDPGDVLAAATTLLNDPAAYREMTGHPNPYGDGHAAQRIASVVARALRD